MKPILSALIAVGFVCTVSAGSISLVCDNNMPDPNEEVTVYVHTDTPLFALGACIFVIGDANITTGMCEADCNQYGWDNGWNSDPYIDPNGWVYLSGVRWASDANGTVGYFKFRYNSGQVSVYFDQEWSLGIGFDWESRETSYSAFSQDILLFGEPDPNQSMMQGGMEEDVNESEFESEPNSQQQSMSMSEGDAGGVFCTYPDLNFDNTIDFRDFAILAGNWQKTGIDLDGDFDGSGTVDFVDLANLLYYWLVPANWPIEVTSVVDANVTVTNPVDLAIAPDSNLYVLSSSQHQVKIYNNLLQLQNTIDVNAINPKGLAIDANNNIYIADTGNNRILKYEPNGSLDTAFGDSGSGNGQFSQPKAIAIDWNGKIYVADSNNNRVQIFDSNGVFLGKWGEFGVSDGNLSNPSGMCLLGNNEIFVADTNNNRLQRLAAASGYFLSKVGSYGSNHAQFKAPHGICYDIAFDQLIVADANNNRIQIFQLHNHGGNSSSQITFAKAVSDHNLSHPMAVACKYDPNDPNQVVFVADTGNNRVLKLQIESDTPANKPTTKFASFKSALEVNDVNTAVTFMDSSVAEKYKVLFGQNISQLQNMVSNMGQMTLESQDEGMAVYELSNAAGTLSYPVVFSKDEMGNWKIIAF
jgi:sugar lactone lactonase YvrE